ncbi:MAG: Tfp pilus assembly protein FimT/FimU [Planctomycetota bacterium]
MQPNPSSAGFSLIEIMVAVALVGLGVAIVVPNLSALVPESRIDGAAKKLREKLVLMRSEARIQAKKMAVEIDLDRERYRLVFPPEDRLTSEDKVVKDEDLGDSQKDWIAVDPDVDLAAAGDARNGLAEKDLYQVVFDEYGFSADQVIALRLKSDPTMTWTLSVRGLTGKVELHKNEEGVIFQPDYVEEGNF